MVTEMKTLDSIKKGNVLLDFYTSTCAPCKALHPVLDEIAEEFKNLTVTKVDVAQNPDAAQMFGVMSVPTVILLKDSKVQDMSTGFSNKAKIRSMIQKYCA